MAAPFLARLLPTVGHVAGRMFAKPQAPADYVGLAGRLLPEFLAPAMIAGNLPEGTSWGERGGSFVENLLLGSGASLAGEFLGGVTGRGFSGSRLGRRFAGGREFRRQYTEQGMNVGGVLGNVASWAVPTPYTNRVLEDAYRKEQERQIAEQQAQDMNLYAQLGGSGLQLAQGVFDPRLLM